MRTGLSLRQAISIRAANCSSRLAPRPTLPGLMRYFARASAQSGCSASSLCPLKWKSPTRGTSQPSASSCSRMRGTCAAASAVLTVTRTISEPARASSKTWAAVRPASAVSVFVIDCTRTGAPPPISACPTRTGRVLCLGMFVIGRSIQRQSGDFDLDVGFQIDGLVVVGKTHRRAVADHKRQGRPPEDDSAASGGIQLRHQRLAVPVPDLDPGFAVELEPNPRFACDAAASSRGLLHLRSRGLAHAHRRRRRHLYRCGRRGGRSHRRRFGLRLRGRRIRLESCPGKSAHPPFIEYATHDDEYENRKSEVGSCTAFAASRKGDALVAQIEVDLTGNVLLLERAQHRLRIRFEQLGVTAHHPAHEGRSGQLVELLGFERLDLTHAVFEALRDVGDRQLTLGAQLREQPSGPGLHGRYVGFDPLVHSYRPFCSSWYSFELGKRLRIR